VGEDSEKPHVPLFPLYNNVAVKCGFSFSRELERHARVKGKLAASDHLRAGGKAFSTWIRTPKFGELTGIGCGFRLSARLIGKRDGNKSHMRFRDILDRTPDDGSSRITGSAAKSNLFDEPPVGWTRLHECHSSNSPASASFVVRLSLVVYDRVRTRSQSAAGHRCRPPQPRESQSPCRHAEDG